MSEARIKAFAELLNRWHEYVEVVEQNHPDGDWWDSCGPDTHVYDFALHLQYALWEEDVNNEAIAHEVEKAACREDKLHAIEQIVEQSWQEYVAGTDEVNGVEFWDQMSAEEFVKDFTTYLECTVK